MLSGCLSLPLTQLNEKLCCWLINSCPLQYYSSPAQLLWKAHIINITYSLLMRSTKILLLWLVKHFITVFMLPFEALGLEAYCFLQPKTFSLSSCKTNSSIWAWGSIQLTHNLKIGDKLKEQQPQTKIHGVLPNQLYAACQKL